MNKHEQIIVNFMRENPTWKRYKLRFELNKIFRQLSQEEYGEDFSEEGWERIPLLYYIPDGFEIDIANRTLNLLEVDDTSALSKQKARNLVNFWWALDDRNWFITLKSIAAHSGAISYMNDYDFQTLAHRQITENYEERKFREAA